MIILNIYSQFLHYLPALETYVLASDSYTSNDVIEYVFKLQGGKLHPLLVLLTSAVRTAEEPNVLLFWVPYGTPALLTVDVEKGLPET